MGGEYLTPIFDLGVGSITVEIGGSGGSYISLYEYDDGSLTTDHAPLLTHYPQNTGDMAAFEWSAAELKPYLGKTVFLRIVDRSTTGYISLDNLKYPALWKIDEGAATLAAVPAGRLLSYPRWDPAVDKPGQETAITVSFRTNGKVPIGGNVVMSLPASYHGTGTALSVSFTEPSSAAGTISGGYEEWKASQGKIYTTGIDGYAIDNRTLFVDSLTFGRNNLQSGHQYGAFCPNSCSRHGTCRNFGKCTCYHRPGTTDPAWIENDCSLRTCSKGKAWTDLASGNHKAHSVAECSMAG